MTAGTCSRFCDKNSFCSLRRLVQLCVVGSLEDALLMWGEVQAVVADAHCLVCSGYAEFCCTRLSPRRHSPRAPGQLLHLLSPKRQLPQVPARLDAGLFLLSCSAVEVPPRCEGQTSCSSWKDMRFPRIRMKTVCQSQVRRNPP